MGLWFTKVTPVVRFSFKIERQLYSEPSVCLTLSSGVRPFLTLDG